MKEVSIDDLLDALDTHKKYMSDHQAARLSLMLNQVKHPDEVNAAAPDALNDLLLEVQAQMAFLKGFREQVMMKGNSASTREVKDMIQASTSLFTMLTKMNEGITNQDRLRKVENATVEVIRTLPAAAQSEFFTALEAALAK